MFNDAQNMLNKVMKEKLFRAIGQVGFYPANSKGDDILVYSPTESSNSPLKVFHGIRQQVSYAYFLRRITNPFYNCYYF